MKIKVEMLEDYKERLKGMLKNKDPDWKINAQVSTNSNKIDQDAFSLLTALKDSPKVPSSSDVLFDGELAILNF
jgi:hypothetical protein